MNPNNQFKSIPQAIQLFAMANSILESGVFLGKDNMHQVLEIIEKVLAEIDTKQKAVQQIFFGNNKPSFIIGNEPTVYALYFLVNQYKIRGERDEDLENLINAIKSNKNFSDLASKFKAFTSDTKNAFELIKYPDFVNTFSSVIKFT